MKFFNIKHDKLYKLIILAAVLVKHWNKTVAKFNQEGKQNKSGLITKNSLHFYIWCSLKSTELKKIRAVSRLMNYNQD